MAGSKGCNPPEGFVCETEEGFYNGVRCHLYHNPKTGEYKTEAIAEDAEKSEGGAA